ncbi:hypothetical protein BCR36DRAFT_365881 [Piromyces finnis]|uniref:Uncharacterized protein n=1 Tax=Piromyces finnis TaxID=1754191 RepID=A0A1Y1VM74_9FUNG|nr:hypothetical protein BCR36DRAFT_365881 [Piromyces finnis]|eukprot:ORX59869.1 hypothetical protein BCR36DRAFT_365881 [Piromyces finnis]
MICLSIKFITFLFLLFIKVVLSVPTSLNQTNFNKDEKQFGKLLKNVIDYHQICDLHYNPDMSDKEIANWLSDAVNYSLNMDIIKYNITDYEDIQELCLIYEDILISNLQKADKTFNSNEHFSRESCHWLNIIGCGALYITIMGTCGPATIATGGMALIGCLGTIGATGTLCILLIEYVK